MESLENEKLVTPCVGVWIEMAMEYVPYEEPKVTPCVGVWIEILRRAPGWHCRSHSLCGSVD